MCGIEILDADAMAVGRDGAGRGIMINGLLIGICVSPDVIDFPIGAI
jgi:hypothetical protein